MNNKKLEDENALLKDYLFRTVKLAEENKYDYDDDVFDKLPTEVIKWYRNQEVEFEKERRELKEKALAKLTPEERMALGY